MKTYRLICKTDPYHASIYRRFNPHTGISVIAEHLTHDEAMEAIFNEAVTGNGPQDDSLCVIESEESAREWLDEIENDASQEQRKAWLRGIIESGEYGVYYYDGPIVYRLGDTDFSYDIYSYSVEEEESEAIED